MLKYFSTITAILFSIMLASQVQATTVLYQNFDQLVDGADHVVSGTVSTIESAKEGGNDIFTTITLTSGSIIDQSGQLPVDQPILLRYYGGNITSHGAFVDDIEGLHIAGTPDLSIGQKVILFVKDNGTSMMPFFGWGQGVFVIGDDGSVSNIEKGDIVSMRGPDILFRSNIKDLHTDAAFAEQFDAAFANAANIGKAKNKATPADALNTGPLPMNSVNFISMIQERKAMNVGARSRSTITTDALFSLPAISKEHSQIIAREPINVIDNTVNPSSSGNEEPGKL